MLKFLILIASIAATFTFSSCGSAGTKADVSDTLKSSKPADNAAPENNPAPDARSAAAEPVADKVSILTNIDSYLVSAVAYPEPATLTVTNKLNEFMIQKIIAEVVISKDNGDTVRTDFYILENLEPGGSKSTKINTGGAGTKASCHILKLRSDELTDGQLILVGSKFSGIK